MDYRDDWPRPNRDATEPFGHFLVFLAIVFIAIGTVCTCLRLPRLGMLTPPNLRDAGTPPPPKSDPPLRRERKSRDTLSSKTSVLALDSAGAPPIGQTSVASTDDDTSTRILPTETLLHESILPRGVWEGAIKDLQATLVISDLQQDSSRALLTLNDRRHQAVSVETLTVRLVPPDSVHFRGIGFTWTQKPHGFLVGLHKLLGKPLFALDTLLMRYAPGDTIMTGEVHDAAHRRLPLTLVQRPAPVEQAQQ